MPKINTFRLQISPLRTQISILKSLISLLSLLMNDDVSSQDSIMRIL